MKNIFCCILAVLAMAAPSAFAEGFYVGAGAAVMKESLAVSQDEQSVIGMSDVTPATRTEDGRHTAAQLVLGWGFNDRWSLEFGYLGGDNGASATTTGEGVLMPGNNMTIKLTQTHKVTATSLSVIGKKQLGETFGVFGRVGAMQVKTTVTSTGGITDSLGNQLATFEGEEKSKKSSALFGVGLTAKLFGNSSLRAEVQKASALPAVMASATLVWGF